MTAAVNASYDIKLKVNETLAFALDNAADPTVLHGVTEHKGNLSGTTTPAVTKVWSDDITLASGIASIDLTALSNGNLPNVDMTGLKIQAYKFACPNTNTSPIRVYMPITVSGPAIVETGYNLFGNSNSEVVKVIMPPKAIMTANENSTSVDLATAGVPACDLIVLSGDITDGTFTFTLQESDDDSAWSDVSAGDGGGTMVFTASIDDFWERLQYIGTKRYIRLELVVTLSPATGGYFTAYARWQPGFIEVLPGQAITAFCDDETADVTNALGDAIKFHGIGTEVIEVVLVAG